MQYMHTVPGVKEKVEKKSGVTTPHPPPALLVVLTLGIDVAGVLMSGLLCEYSFFSSRNTNQSISRSDLEQLPFVPTEQYLDAFGVHKLPFVVNQTRPTEPQQ